MNRFFIAVVLPSLFSIGVLGLCLGLTIANQAPLWVTISLAFIEGGITFSLILAILIERIETRS